VTTRDIRTSHDYSVCDVCGRTLLRGEKADVYLHGATRRSVCELCKERAIHEGWVREGTLPSYNDNNSGSERRRSLLSRLRARRDAATAQQAADRIVVAGELDGNAYADLRVSRRDDYAPRADRSREPRHVRAVPSSVEHKVASAVELFNASAHPRTVAGVARSLGVPTVSVAPSPARTSLVNVVVAWELCWYRYEVDLSDDQPSVRVVAQGYELDELTPAELQPNAIADERGSLSL
jgi:hypothetical protein